MATPNWLVYALGSAFFAALTAIFGKIGVAELPSNFATLIRTVVILLVTSLFVTVQREWQPLASVSKHSLLFLVLSGMATGLSWLCYYRALQLGPASRVAPIDKLSVVMVILFSFVFLREAFSIKVLIGGALITIGSILIALG